MIVTDRYVSEIRLKRETVASFDEYPFSLPAVRFLDALKLDTPVTYIVGENGSGKSTLLEGIAVAWGFNAEGGSRNFRFSTRTSHSPLHDHLVLVKGVATPKDGFFLRAESFFNVATEIENLGRDLLDAYGGRSLHEQSHGESFLALLMNRFRGNGFYLLDEPEAALSPQRQLAVLSRIHDLVQNKSQFIIATHSPILMSYPGSTIYSLASEGITKLEYTETEHYQVTKNFLANPARMLEILMDSQSPSPKPKRS
jgi:predicted ATPase